MSFRDADNDPSFWIVTRRASRIFTLKAPKPRNSTRARAVVREFVKYSAENPQLHRLMTMEGRRESERLVWLIRRHVSRFFAISTKLIQEAQALGVVRPGDPGQLHYCAIGIATAAFSLAPEYKLVTGKDPFTRSHIEQIADLVCEFLFIRSGS